MNSVDHQTKNALNAIMDIIFKGQIETVSNSTKPVLHTQVLMLMIVQNVVIVITCKIINVLDVKMDVKYVNLFINANNVKAVFIYMIIMVIKTVNHAVKIEWNAAMKTMITQNVFFDIIKLHKELLIN